MEKMKYKINNLSNIIIMVLLLFISLILSMLIMIINITDEEIYINYLREKDLIDEIYIKPKNNENYIPNDTIEFLDKELNKNSIKLYKLNDTDFFANYENEKIFFNLKNDNLYYKIIKKNEFDNMEIIGEYPKNKNEIIINEILAYEILNDYSRKIYNAKEKITSYEELINKVITYKNEHLKIAGIKQENLGKYESLLNENNKKDESDLYKEFESRYSIKKNIIFVNEKFFENNIEYKYNKNVELEDEIIKVNLNISDLRENKNIYDWIVLNTNINNLNNDEIIIDLNLVDILSKGDLKEKYTNIEWSKLNFQNDEEYYEYFEQFIINYLHNIDLVGKELILDDKSYNIKGVFIKNYMLQYGEKDGYSLAFVNNNILDNYIKENLVSILEYKNLNIDDINKIYKQSSKYNIDILTKYDNNYREIIHKKNNIKNYMIFTSSILGIILFLLLCTNYKTNRNHINNLKKNKYFKFLVIEILVIIVLIYISFCALNIIYFEKSLVFNYSSILFIIINVIFLNFMLLLSNNTKLNH